MHEISDGRKRWLLLLSHSVMSTLFDPMDCSKPGCPVLHQFNSQSLLKLMSTDLVTPFNHLILCHTFLLLPSIFPSIKIFSNESALCIRWSKYWSFSISLSSEYSRLISFSIDSPGKSTGVGCHFLLQGIFPAQRQNLCLLRLLHSAGRVLYH